MINIEDGAALVAKTRTTRYGIVLLATGDMWRLVADYGERCEELGLDEPPGDGLWWWEGEIVDGARPHGALVFQGGYRRARQSDVAPLLESP